MNMLLIVRIMTVICTYIDVEVIDINDVDGIDNTIDMNA
jgi:hypothetical protein